MFHFRKANITHPIIVTPEIAKHLHPSDVLHHNDHLACDGYHERWRVNGAPQVWVNQPDRVRVPLKHGLYDYAQLTETNCTNFHLAKYCTH